MKQWYVYILASKRNGTLYIGITNNLARRGDEHREADTKSFTNKYKEYLLVYFEAFDNPDDAIHREKNLKKWKRAWKIRVIEELIPDWQNLAMEILV